MNNKVKYLFDYIIEGCYFSREIVPNYPSQMVVYVGFLVY